MEIKQLCDALMGKARTEALKKLVTGKRNRVVTVDGLAGSAVAMVLFGCLFVVGMFYLHLLRKEEE